MTDLKILEDLIPYVSDVDHDTTITSKKEVVVYILLGRHKEQWVFKIGRTNRLQERIKEIERETQLENCFILCVYHSFKNSVYRACRDIDSLIFHDQSKVKQLYALADVRKKKGTGTKEFYIACLEIWNIFHELCQKYKGKGIKSRNCKFEDTRIIINGEIIVSLDSYSCTVSQIPTRYFSPPVVSHRLRSYTPDDDDDASDVSTRVTPEPPVYRTPIRRSSASGGGLSRCHNSDPRFTRDFIKKHLPYDGVSNIVKAYNKFLSQEECIEIIIEKKLIPKVGDNKYCKNCLVGRKCSNIDLHSLS